MKANCVSMVHVHTHAVHMCQVCIISTLYVIILLLYNYTHRLAYNYTVEPLNKGHHWDPDYPQREVSLIQR